MTRFLTLLFCIATNLSLVIAQDAVVDANYGGKPGARVDSVPHYATIAAALQPIPESNTKPFVIYIKNGIYKEKLRIDRANIHFIGESQDGTIITYDASGDTPAPDGGTYGTQGSFTLQISAPGFRAENLTIENCDCYMDDHLGPEGYARISALDSTGRRVWFEVGTDSRFFEYGSFWTGAIKSSKRPTLEDDEMVWYSKANALNGWLPECTAR